MIVIDDRHMALYVNKAARDVARQRRLLRVSRRTQKLALRDEHLQTDLTRLVHEALQRRPSIVRSKSGHSSIEICCLDWRWFRGSAYVVSVSENRPASSERALRVLQRVYQLTPSEARVAFLLCEGAARARIVEELQISQETVRSHLAEVYRKVGVQSQVGLVRVVTEKMVRLG